MFFVPRIDSILENCAYKVEIFINYIAMSCMRLHEKMFVSLAAVLGINELGPMGIRGVLNAYQEGDNLYQGLDVFDINTTGWLLVVTMLACQFLPDKKSK